MSLTLHKELGVNARMTTCPRCGGGGPELVLLGAHNWIDTCDACGCAHVGGAKGRRCQKCGGPVTRRVLEEMERVPGSALCEKCEAAVKLLADTVAAGGVYWRCKDCGAQGAVRAGTFAAAVRESHGIAAPAACGVEFSKDDCPRCGPEKLPAEEV